jgi:hypothetical protein
MYNSKHNAVQMREGAGHSTLGVVSRAGLSARVCQLLRATCDRQDALRVRMRREDIAHEHSNYLDSEPNASRVYKVLVSTGKNNIRLDLRVHDELQLHFPTTVSGRRVLFEVTFEVRHVRAVVAGLRPCELMHRAIIEIAATSD